MYHVIKETEYQCSKCESKRIVKPLYDANWEIRCLDCGHTKPKVEPSDPTVDSWTNRIDKQKPVSF